MTSYITIKKLVTMVKDVWYCIVDDGARMARHEGDAVHMACIPEAVSGAPTS
jgi:hypothetical protein